MVQSKFRCVGAIFGIPVLVSLLACGGGGSSSETSSTTASGLVYTATSATTSDWRVEVEPSTNGASTILLHVYGPTGAVIRGATLFLSCNASQVAWVQPSGATDAYAKAGTALDLTQGPNASFQLFKSHLSGSALQVAAYQKTGTATLTTSNPLFSVALALKSGVSTGTVGLSATSGRTSVYVDGTGEHTLSLRLGTLVAE